MSEICLGLMAPGDLSFLRELRSNPLVADWLFGPTRPITPAEQEMWYNRVMDDSSHQVWIAKTTMERVGYGQVYGVDHSHYSAEIGVAVLPLFYKQGYGGQIVLKLLRWCFEDVGLNSVVAKVFTDNSAAVMMFSRCGFTVCGVMPEAIFKGGEYRDIYVMTALRREYDKAT